MIKINNVAKATLFAVFLSVAHLAFLQANVLVDTVSNDSKAAPYGQVTNVVAVKPVSKDRNS